VFERKKQQVTVPSVETKQITVPTVAGVKSALTGSARTAQAKGGATLDGAKHAAAPMLDGAKAAAAPMLAAAGAAVAPRLGEARERVEHDVLPRVADTRDHLVEAKDAFVEETLPKIVEAVTGVVAASAVAKSDAVAKVRDSGAAHRAADAAAVLKGDKIATDKKSGGFFSGLVGALGILGLAGAAAWFFNKRAIEQDDPWARPLADPYLPPTSGRNSTVGTDSAAGQVSDVPAEDNDLIPPSADAVADQEIRVIDPMNDASTGEATDGPEDKGADGLNR